MPERRVQSEELCSREDASDASESNDSSDRMRERKEGMNERMK